MFHHWKNKDKSWPLGDGTVESRTQDHGSLVLLDSLHGEEEREGAGDDDEDVTEDDEGGGDVAPHQRVARPFGDGQDGEGAGRPVVGMVDDRRVRHVHFGRHDE